MATAITDTFLPAHLANRQPLSHIPERGFFCFHPVDKLKLIDVIDVLCDGQIPREEIPKALKVNTLTGKGSLEEVRLAISQALIQSMPEKDESDMNYYMNIIQF